ncbi:hypothetical protein ACFQS1_03455 [Paractinoplanes rhizophilus]|jgi:hypothetical protein|uniref:Uncharacterized protein n=1 Tax=Paractinoplanes rhizophilus TaxID=1416877 RepID=A0ABW2HMG4_9ACTN|nr:hypothetical protein [Actinoplanes sp.]
MRGNVFPRARVAKRISPDQPPCSCGALLGAVGGRWLLIISGLGVTATLALVGPLLSRALSPDRRNPATVIA